MNSVVDGLLFV